MEFLNAKVFLFFPNCKSLNNQLALLQLDW